MRLDPRNLAFPMLQGLPVAPIMGLAAAGRRWAAREIEQRFGCDVSLKTAVDRAAIAYRLLCGPALSSKEWHEVAHEVDGALRLYRARGWLENPAAFHTTPPELRNVEDCSSRSRRRAFRHVRFESGYAPHPGEPGRERWRSYAANRTAHAWVLEHADGRPRPWVVCIHGYGMGFPIIDFEAFPLRKLHDRLGMNVILPVLPLHGPRRIGYTSGERFLDGHCLDTIHSVANALWDLRRLLSWVRAREATSIGVYGLSLGGYHAALLASLESDLACVVAGIPAVDFLRLGRLHSRSRTLSCAERTGVVWDQIGCALRVISPLAMRPRIERHRLYMFAGAGDRIVPPDQVEDLWKHWGRPRMAWYPGGHFSFRWEPLVRELLADAIQTHLCDEETAEAA
jgi:hypothetical protein